MLFDGLFAEIDKFADWLAKRPPAFFFTAYGKAARSEHAELQRMLTDRGVGFGPAPGAAHARQRDALAVGDDVAHNDFMTRAWSGPAQGGAGADPGLCAQRPGSERQAKLRPPSPAPASCSNASGEPRRT